MIHYKGIITPLATPLTQSGDGIDHDGTRRLLSHVISGGVTGIFILGSTGEGPSLSPQLRRDFVKLCCNSVREMLAATKAKDDGEESRHFPILVGVSDTCVGETIALAEYAADCGADAV